MDIFTNVLKHERHDRFSWNSGLSHRLPQEKSCTAYHETMRNGLVADTKSQVE